MKIIKTVATVYKVGNRRFFSKRAAIRRAIWMMVAEEMGRPSKEDSPGEIEVCQQLFDELFASYKAGNLAVDVEVSPCRS